MKRFIAFVLSLTLCIFDFIRPLVADSAKYTEDYQFVVKFGSSVSQYTNNFSDYDFFIVVLKKYSSSALYPFFYAISSDDSKSKLYFSPSYTLGDSFLIKGDFSKFGINTNYSFIRFDTKNIISNSLLKTFSFDSFSSNDELDNQNSFIFDNFNSDSFLSSSRIILASNVDIYSYDGTLLQEGNTDDLLEYCPFLKSLKITDYTGNATSESVTKINGSSGSSDEGGSDDSENDKDYSGLLGGIAKVIDSLNNPLTDILDYLSHIHDNISSILNTVFQGFFDSFASVCLVISNLFGKTESIDNSFTEFNLNFDTFSETVNTSFNDITTKITDLTANLETNFNNIKNKVTDFNTDFNLKFGLLFGYIDKLQLSLDSIFDEFNFEIEGNFAFELEKLFDDLSIDISGSIDSLELSLTAEIDSLIDSLDFDVEGSFSFKLGKIFDDLKLNIDSLFGSLIDDLDINLGDIKIKIDSINSSIGSKLDDIYAELQAMHTTVKAIPLAIKNILVELFVPSDENRYQAVIELIYNKFGFVNQILNFGDMLTDINYTDEPPQFSLNFDSDTYGHFSMSIIDWSVVNPYIRTIRAINSGIIVYFFIRRTRKRLPTIISGGGAE